MGSSTTRPSFTSRFSRDRVVSTRRPCEVSETSSPIAAAMS
ncbi:hypothetical protein ABT403_33135 [Streptomyces sp. NPDC000075]